MNALRQTAYDWHGGQCSALYSFASTGGVIHDKAHRDSLEAEIQSCTGSQYCSIPDRIELLALLTHVKDAKLKKELESSKTL